MDAWLAGVDVDDGIAGELTAGAVGDGGDESEEKWAPGRFSLAWCRFAGGARNRGHGVTGDANLAAMET
jgi:hypothetical protein